MWLYPRNYLILFSLIGLLSLVLYQLEADLDSHLFDRTQAAWANTDVPPKKVSLVHIDFTLSDSLIAEDNSPYRQLLEKVLDANLQSSQDVLAAYLIHAHTQDNQPFYSTHSVFHPQENSQVTSKKVIAQIRQAECLEQFDSISTYYQRGRNHFTTQDTTWMAFSNVIGTLQNAVVYYRRYALPKDDKRLYFLSDMQETGGIYGAIFKTEAIESKEEINTLTDLAIEQLNNISDINIRKELKNTEIYILTPNEHLYSTKFRNFNRIFWETFFLDKLQCKNVYFF